MGKAVAVASRVLTNGTVLVVLLISRHADLTVIGIEAELRRSLKSAGGRDVDRRHRSFGSRSKVFTRRMVRKGEGYAKTTPPGRGTTPKGVAAVSQPNGSIFSPSTSRPHPVSFPASTCCRQQRRTVSPFGRDGLPTITTTGATIASRHRRHPPPPPAGQIRPGWRGSGGAVRSAGHQRHGGSVDEGGMPEVVAARSLTSPAGVATRAAARCRRRHLLRRHIRHQRRRCHNRHQHRHHHRQPPPPATPLPDLAGHGTDLVTTTAAMDSSPGLRAQRGRDEAPPPPSLRPRGFAGACSGGGEAEEAGRGRRRWARRFLSRLGEGDAGAPTRTARDGAAAAGNGDGGGGGWARRWWGGTTMAARDGRGGG
uniref:Uncharacterized protein n=1 Tax=Oryza sativa subsp. japonica TaxID=39947 RepID=Q69P87_ORYSJ|nr:hypothetical protein [Oryza sativa Japonica Group]